jgi:redox-sensing transcriptional repressor
MRRKKAISDAVIERLPLYYRDLLLLQDAGIDIISSEKLGERLGITPEQIRKDLTCFGAFGKKGVGYYVSELCQQIVEIIGLQQHWKIGIVGIGHLGWALANYKTFGRLGFRTTGLFDVDHRVIGQNVGGVIVTPISEMGEVIQREGIQIGIITTPASVAQQVANQMVAAGIKGILSFAPLRLSVPDNIFVFREDLSIGLSRISYYLTNKPQEKE